MLDRSGSKPAAGMNARQRRTLKRAKNRAVKGLIEAGWGALLRGADNELPSEMPTEMPPASRAAGEGLGSPDVTPSSLAATAAGIATGTATATISTRGNTTEDNTGEGSINSPLNTGNNSLELDELDAVGIIEQLNRRKEEGAHVEDGLLRDLQIVQELVVSIKQQAATVAAMAALGIGSGGGSSAVGIAPVGSAGGAAGNVRYATSAGSASSGAGLLYTATSGDYGSGTSASGSQRSSLPGHSLPCSQRSSPVKPPAPALAGSSSPFFPSQSHAPDMQLGQGQQQRHPPPPPPPPPPVQQLACGYS